MVNKGDSYDEIPPLSLYGSVFPTIVQFVMVAKFESSQLIEMAADLFKVNGYHNTSIADIANACNLSKASIYHHISSKQELGIAALKQHHDYFTKNIFSNQVN